jgi:multiple sugar transport system ATP-binding protein
VATVSVEGVSKVYPGDIRAVDDVTLDIAEGEFMVLVGPSGCGKTTLLRMVAGLEDITEGVIRIGDKAVNNTGPKHRDVAMVFQNYALYPHMSVAQNIGLALTLRRHPKRDVERRVTDAAQVLGLSDWLHRRPGQLSGGQRQRVAMGRAIVRHPSVFLMDEPLSNLDAQLRVQMRTEVSRLQARIGVATMYVTHDQVEAMTMGHRVAVLNRGVLQQVAAPKSLYDRPVNLFVATFIGSPPMNLYEASLSEGANVLWLGSQPIPIPETVRGARPALAGYASRKVVVGLRPEHLPAVGADAKPALKGEVTLVEALGSHLLVHFTADARRATPDDATGEDDTVAGQGEGVARVDPHSPLTPGMIGSFAVDVERMHFFDPLTGCSIWGEITHNGHVPLSETGCGSTHNEDR